MTTLYSHWVSATSVPIHTTQQTCNIIIIHLESRFSSPRDPEENICFL